MKNTQNFQKSNQNSLNYSRNHHIILNLLKSQKFIKNLRNYKIYPINIFYYSSSFRFFHSGFVAAYRSPIRI